MKKILTFLFLCIVFNVFAQFPISLTLSPAHQFFNAMQANCFNPEDPAGQPVYLTAILNGTYDGFYKIRIDISYGDASALVWLISDNPFVPGTVLNNQQFINNDPIGYEVDGDYDDLVDELEGVLYDTGKMPDGTYVVQMQVFALNDDPLSEIQTATFTIESPWAIDLVTPGAPFGLNLVEISNQFPDFLWLSNFSEYTFYLWQIDESVTSGEEIENMQPDEEVILNSYFYSYPPSATTQLEQGNIYAWQVRAETITPLTSQNVTMKSPIYAFKITQTGSVTPPIDPGVVQNLINQFASTGQGGQQILNLLQNGYAVQTINWQGQNITLEELMNILNSGLYQVGD